MLFTCSVPVAYFSDMTKHLVANGYTRGKDLRAAPYDFRKAPSEWTYNTFLPSLAMLAMVVFSSDSVSSDSCALSDVSITKYDRIFESLMLTR